MAKTKLARIHRRSLRRQHLNERIVHSVESSRRYQKPTRFIKVSNNTHTGKKLPWHSTSYAVLFFLLIFTAVFSFVCFRQISQAANDISLSGKVLGPPPTTAPIITSPTNGQHTSNNLIAVSGTCTSALLVEIYRNGAFAGSVPCSGSDSFTINITLVTGANQLIAKVSDSVGQYGPDSQPVTVFYDIPKTAANTSTSPGSVATLPLLLYTEPVQQGSSRGQPSILTYEVAGGIAPYALSISWGDGQDEFMPVGGIGKYQVKHTYDQPGQYIVTLSMKDTNQELAFMQTIIIVNGKADASLLSKPLSLASLLCSQPDGLQTFDSGSILHVTLGQKLTCRIIESASYVWPVLIIAALMTFSFWAGERVILLRYTRIIRRHN